MSATFNKNDTEWVNTMVKQGRFSPDEVFIINTAFEHQTDADAENIRTQMKKEKYVRKICLLKTLSFPLEIILITFLFGLEEAKHKKEINSLYLKFLRKKISYTKFQKNLQELAKDGKVI